AVLGAGVSGLTTAISLIDAGCQVRVAAADPTEATTSYLAAAVWFPTHAGPPDRVAAWGRTTYDVLAAQAGRKVPGVVMRESLALYREAPEQPDWAAAVKSVREATPAELPPGYPYGLRFVVPMVEMPKYLPWLIEQFTSRGGQLHRRRVGSLAELADEDTDAVVNCSGIASRTLVGDASVYPVRGQIVRVTNPGLTMSVRDEQHPAGRAYVHPRSEDCILGGTLELNNWDTTIDLATSAAIIERCREIVPALRGASVIEDLVGLRPGRPTVRVEEDHSQGATARILHNYGHGGSGITISWGCAYEVTELLLRT
ncbi:MAG: D-amino-acid oxidase, partial [Mycobacterium sp.]|nr:D-amino-acid oxidase [Mycobacterium sp.]